MLRWQPCASLYKGLTGWQGESRLIYEILKNIYICDLIFGPEEKCTYILPIGERGGDPAVGELRQRSLLRLSPAGRWVEDDILVAGGGGGWGWGTCQPSP